MIWIVDDELWPFIDRVAPAVIALVDLASENDHRSARELLSEMQA